MKLKKNMHIMVYLIVLITTVALPFSSKILSNDSEIRLKYTFKTIKKGFYVRAGNWIANQNRIIFQTDDSIYIYDVDSKQMEKELTISKMDYFLPLEVSVRGDLIIRNNDMVYVYNLKTKQKKYLFTGECSNIRWSPDGLSLAYIKFLESIWVYDLGKKAKINIAEGCFENVRWSKDGKKILFIEPSKPNLGTRPWNVWVYDLATQKKSVVIEQASGAEWINNDQIAFLRVKTLYIKDLSTQKETAIALITSENRSPYIGFDSFSISPSGDSILYDFNNIGFLAPVNEGELVGRSPQTGNEIYEYDLKSSKSYNLTNTHDRYEVKPTWSSNGKVILIFVVKGIDDRYFEPYLGECDNSKL